MAELNPAVAVAQPRRRRAVGTGSFLAPWQNRQPESWWRAAGGEGAEVFLAPCRVKGFSIIC